MFCTKCGQQLEEGSKFCVKCGTHVNMAQGITNQENMKIATVDEKDETENTIICPKCKEPVNKNNKYCEKCGAMFPNEKRKRRILDGLTFIIVLVIWFVIMFHLEAEWNLFKFFLFLVVGIIGAFPVMLILGVFTKKFFSKK